MCALALSPSQNSSSFKSGDFKTKSNFSPRLNIRSGTNPSHLLAELSKEALFGQAIKYAEGSLNFGSGNSPALEKLALGDSLIKKSQIRPEMRNDYLNGALKAYDEAESSRTADSFDKAYAKGMSILAYSGLHGNTSGIKREAENYLFNLKDFFKKREANYFGFRKPLDELQEYRSELMGNVLFDPEEIREKGVLHMAQSPKIAFKQGAQYNPGYNPVFSKGESFGELVENNSHIPNIVHNYSFFDVPLYVPQIPSKVMKLVPEHQHPALKQKIHNRTVFNTAHNLANFMGLTMPPYVDPRTYASEFGRNCTPSANMEFLG